MDELDDLINKIKECIDLQTNEKVDDNVKTNARKRLIDLVTFDHPDNWQYVATPYKIASKMIDLLPDLSDSNLFVVFFSLEFLEILVKERNIKPENIIFISDNWVEGELSSNKNLYDVKTIGLSKKSNYINGKVNLSIVDNEIKGNYMKFNKVSVVMNPPYQINDGGGTGSSAKPIYNLFIESVIDTIKPDYMVSINPSRWMVGGKGLDSFRTRMMNDRRIKTIVDHSGEKDIFKTVNIEGGVNYFLWDKSYNGKCSFISGNTHKKRYLNQFDVIVKDNTALSIIEKVLDKHSKFIGTKCFSRNPFSIRSDFNNWVKTGTKCLIKGNKFKKVLGTDFVDKNDIQNKWKVVLSKANGAAQKDRGKGKRVISDMIILEPGSICSETYLVVNTFDDEKSAIMFRDYSRTKFFRFMLQLRLSSINFSKNCFNWVPDFDYYDKKLTDTDLCKLFNLTEHEIYYLDKKISNIPNNSAIMNDIYRDIENTKYTVGEFSDKVDACLYAILNANDSDVLINDSNLNLFRKELYTVSRFLQRYKTVSSVKHVCWFNDKKNKKDNNPSSDFELTYDDGTTKKLEVSVSSSKYVLNSLDGIENNIDDDDDHVFKSLDQYKNEINRLIEKKRNKCMPDKNTILLITIISDFCIYEPEIEDMINSIDKKSISHFDGVYLQERNCVYNVKHDTSIKNSFVLLS